MPQKLLIIGISGVTCGGKTTLAHKLNDFFPNSRLISQDDYFLDVDDPRHVWIPELNHINFDILSSLDMKKMEDDILKIIKNKQLIKICKNGTNKNSHHQCIDKSENMIKSAAVQKMKEADLEILIVEGFCIFNYTPLRHVFHLKYYFTLSYEDCHERRLQRIYEPPDCFGYFEKCAWPEHVKQLEEVQKEVQGVKYFNGALNTALNEVLYDILDFVEHAQ